MHRTMMKSKIHRATITGADLNYVGSITLDTRLMELADIMEHEQVHVLDIDNGARFETYVIRGGPGDVILNGAAARLVHTGDRVIVITLRAVRRGRARDVRADGRARRRATTSRRCTRYARSRRNPACSRRVVTSPMPNLPVISSCSAAASPGLRRRSTPGTPACRSPCSRRASSGGRPPATRRAAWPPRSIDVGRLARAARLRHPRRGRRSLRRRRRPGAGERRPGRVRELMALGAHFDRRRRRPRAGPGP